jgi:hypothetical protein
MVQALEDPMEKQALGKAMKESHEMRPPASL